MRRIEKKVKKMVYKRGKRNKKIIFSLTKI